MNKLCHQRHQRACRLSRVGFAGLRPLFVKTLGEIRLSSLNTRLRIDGIARLRQLLKGAAPQPEAKLDEDMREAEDMHDNVLKEELAARCVPARDRIVVEVPERESDGSAGRSVD